MPRSTGKSPTPVRTPPVWGYGFDDIPASVRIVMPDGTTSVQLKIEADKNGWWFRVPIEFMGMSVIVTRDDNDHDIFTVPTSPGSSFNAEDHQDGD